MGKEIHEDAAGVVNQVAKTLGNKNDIYVAGSGLFELVEIVIGKRLFERDFDSCGGPIRVGRNAYGHDAPSLHHTGYFG